MSGDNNATLKYDPYGRLYEITPGVSPRPTGPSPPSSDPQDQMIVCHDRLRSVYDGDALVMELDGADTILRRYAHSGGVDQPVVWYEGPVRPAR